MNRDRTRCSKCHRTPVPGELVHRLQSGRLMCTLCLADLPDSERAEVATERVHASERPIAAVPRAA
jgi:hypothetical protein